jgi:hypothetical protein
VRCSRRKSVDLSLLNTGNGQNFALPENNQVNRNRFPTKEIFNLAPALSPVIQPPHEACKFEIRKFDKVRDMEEKCATCTKYQKRLDFANCAK